MRLTFTTKTMEYERLVAAGWTKDDFAKALIAVLETPERAETFTASLTAIAAATREELPVPWCDHCQCWHHHTAQCIK